jgi:hypothetical protein
VRIPSFSRQSSTDSAETETPAAGSTATPVRARVDAPPAPPQQRDSVTAPSKTNTTVLERANLDADHAKVDADHAKVEAERAKVEADRAKVEAAESGARPVPAPVKVADKPVEKPLDTTAETPVVAGPKPRASLLATLSLMLSVAGALLVLSGPLLGYGIGVAGLALVLALCGIHATRRRHVAGKTDALIAMVVSLAAIVVGVLALTGSLSWLGTDMQPVTSLREWLDAQFANRF